MVDALARETHFLAHLAPTWNALPLEIRGTFYVHAGLVEDARAHGIDAEPLPTTRRPYGLPTGPLTLVASYRDLKFARVNGRRVILSEHGAGQSYAGVTSGSYIGAADREGAVAVLVPGQDAAERHLAAHPDIPAYAVGCPKLDAYRDIPPGDAVALSFHWTCRLCPEAGSAWQHYRMHLGKLRGFNVIGHAHPRMLRRVRSTYIRRGIPVVEDFSDVIRQARTLVIDNSSVLFEWAALDRPVVLLNSPRYRRHVEHGMRFWEYADIGPQVNAPHELPDAIRAADDPQYARRRREVAEQVYAVRENAAQAAAQAVVEIHERYA